VKRLALILVLALSGCAQSRAEERAIDHALGLGFVAPVADCDGELASLPGFLLCNVQEDDPASSPRGIFIACPSGIADSGPCVEPPAGQGFKVNHGAL
jgi:hypothetical protein